MQLLGNRRLIGQHSIREQLSQVLSSDRVSHAYLLAGPAGVGKKALALAMAEVVNGIDNLTDLEGKAFSKKTSWYAHPDIHVFFPVISQYSKTDFQQRLAMLAKDPYEIIDYGLRPTLDEMDFSKNKNDFYPIQFFKEEILGATTYRPHEGKFTVVILANVEKMRKEAANAFLKILEEPGDRLMFILTTDNVNALLPTIISRCQVMPLKSLTMQEVEQGLIEFDGQSQQDAAYLARISGGNYSITRFYDIERLKEVRNEVVDYLRHSFTLDASNLVGLIQSWDKELNNRGLIALLNSMELYIRDLIIYRNTQDPDLVTNVDQIESIQNFVTRLADARLDAMIDEIYHTKGPILQNVNAKLSFISLAFKFHRLMRGLDTQPSANEPWQHMPMVPLL